MGFYHMVHPHLAHRRLRKPGDPVPFLTLANLYSCRPMQLQSLRAHCTFHASWSFEFLAASSHSEKSNADGFYVFHCFYIIYDFQAFQILLESAKGSKAQSQDFECLVQVLSRKLTAHSSTVVDRSQSAIAVPAWTQRFIHLSGSSKKKGRQNMRNWTSKPLHVSESIKKNVLSSVKVTFLWQNNTLNSWSMDSASPPPIWTPEKWTADPLEECQVIQSRQQQT